MSTIFCSEFVSLVIGVTKRMKSAQGSLKKKYCKAERKGKLGERVS